MKKLFTLAAMGLFASASLNANAQFTLDGKATAAEIGTGIGKYQLAGSYGGTHLEADRGLRSLYVGYTATTLNFMLVGSGESINAGAYRAFVVYMNTPARPGTPAGTQLVGGNDTGGSPLAHRPTMDMEVDYGFRCVVGPGASDVYFSAVSYVTGTGTPTPGSDPYVGQGNKTGTVVTAGATATVLPATRYSYFNTTSLAANTSAINSGLEIEIPLSALGGTALTSTSILNFFAAFIDSNGQFITADVIPEISGRTTALGTDPNFTTIPGNQSVAFQLGTGALATHPEAAAAFAFNVYPNPAQASSTIAYKVPAGQQAVSLAVYNAMGQLVRTVANGVQTGAQEYKIGDLAAGTYLVKLQIGNQMTSSKVVVN